MSLNFLNMGDKFLTMWVSFVSMGDNFLNMGDRKLSMALTYRKHAFQDSKVTSLLLERCILMTQKSYPNDLKNHFLTKPYLPKQRKTTV